MSQFVPSPASRYNRLDSPPPRKDESDPPEARSTLAESDSPLLLSPPRPRSLSSLSSKQPLLNDARSSHDRDIKPRQKKRFPRLHFRKFRRRRWFVPIFLLFIAGCLGGVITAAFQGYMKNSFEFRQKSDLTFDGPVVSIEGKVTNIDLVGAKISVTWTLFVCNSFNLTGETDGLCSTPNIPFDIYQNENTTLSARPIVVDKSTGDKTIVGWDPKKRVFGYDPAADSFYWDAEMNLFVWGYWQTFSQDLPFSVQNLMSSKRANDIAYPFDKYHIVTAYLAVAPLTNETYPVSPSFSGVLSNWDVSTEDLASNATGWGMDPNSRQLKIAVDRSGAAIAFAICIFLVNWVITIVIMWQTALVLIWRVEMAESLVVIPLTALFSMPAIRSVAPGNPSFGSFYDVCGFLLQISIVGLCSAIVLFAVLVGKEHVFDPKEEGSRSLRLREMEEAAAESIRSSRRRSSGADSTYSYRDDRGGRRSTDEVSLRDMGRGGALGEDEGEKEMLAGSGVGMKGAQFEEKA